MPCRQKLRKRPCYKPFSPPTDCQIQRQSQGRRTENVTPVAPKDPRSKTGDLSPSVFPVRDRRAPRGGPARGIEPSGRDDIVWQANFLFHKRTRIRGAIAWAQGLTWGITGCIGPVRGAIVTIANWITIARLLSIPFIGWSVVAYTAVQPHWRFVALAAFLAAALSDAVDVFIARVFCQNSRLGAILDPIADKLLINVTLVFLAVNETFRIPCPSGFRRSCLAAMW